MRESADACVVGGGYLGLWTALRLKELEPGLDVILLEGAECGYGASGRNGGLALSWWSRIEALVARAGEQEALRLAQASEAAIDEIGALCAREGIDAQFRRAGWYWAASSVAQVGAWEGAMAARERLGIAPWRVAGRDELSERLGSEALLGAVHDPVAATLEPAALAHGLKRVAEERGVRVLEHTPVHALDRATGTLTTSHGTVTAPRIALASGAWLAHLRELRDALLVVSSDVVASRSGRGWAGGECFSDAALMVLYARSTGEGCVCIGKGGGNLAFRARIDARFDHDPRRTADVVRDARRVLPVLRGEGVERAWAGAVDRSVDGLPFFGLLPGRARVAYGAGFSGSGVAATVIGGRILAASVLRVEDEWSGCGLAAGPPGRWPPEPARYVGGLAVRRAVARKERREADAMHVGRATRGAASLVGRAGRAAL